MRRWIVVAMSVGLGTVCSAAGAAPQERLLEPTDPEWEFTEDARAGTREGEAVLLLRTGRALRRDVEFSEGTIEFEFLPTDRRAFLGVIFRIPEEGVHHEDLYLRLHKSGLPDALQYTPNYHGHGQWQLYHGADATAPATFEPRVWQRARIEVAGDRAALWVGDGSEPRLVVDRLRSGSPSGFLGFWALLPGGTESDPHTALIRNVVIRPGRVSYEFGPVEAESSPAGRVSRWGLSEAFLREGEDIRELPAGIVERPWRPVTAEPSGLVPLDRHLERPEGGPAAVLAGLEIRASAPRTVRLELGYSDDVSVFLNGRLLVSARFGFSTNFPRRQGLVTPDQASVYLPLQAGENRVVVAVSEVFGGWGLMGRIRDREGLTVRPLTDG